MAKDNKNKMQLRIFMIQLFLFAAFLLLGAKSVQLQVFEAESLNRLAEKEYSGHMVMKGKRGKIFDKNMKELSTSIDTLSLAASPPRVKDPENAASKLSDLLDADKSSIYDKLTRDTGFTWIKRRISPEIAGRIKEKKIPGIFFKNDTRRYYPNRGLAAQVLGFTGTDNKGLEGLEYRFNEELAGKDVKIRIVKDATGKRVDTEKRFKSRFAGNSLVLTLDKKIQFVTEQALEHTVTDQNAKSGLAVVMKPATGEILAMAHYPGFNPNRFQDFSQNRWRNRAVADQFEPGSVMKVFLAATALEKNISTPRSIFFCENGAFDIGRYTIHDIRPHEWLTLRQTIKYSSNIGAAKIGASMGNRILYNALTGYGFGSKTGIRFPGETNGRLRHYSKWSKIDTANISFGQGIAVSAIQLITGISALANDGVLMKPLLVKKIISDDGTVQNAFHPEQAGRVISGRTARQVQDIMQAVITEEGTGSNAIMQGYSVCGKTGTAQKVAENGKGYSKDRYTSVFAGFSPADEPELAVLVVVDEPRKDHYGGVVAAPAFKNIMSESFNYLGIPPEKRTPEIVAKVSEGVDP